MPGCPLIHDYARLATRESTCQHFIYRGGGEWVRGSRAPIRDVGTYAPIGLSRRKGGFRTVNGQRGNTRLWIQFRILRFVKLTGAFVRAKCYFPLLQRGLRIDNMGDILVAPDLIKQKEKARRQESMIPIESDSECRLDEYERQSLQDSTRFAPASEIFRQFRGVLC